MRIFLQIVSPIAFLASVVFFIRNQIEYNRRYKAFVDFLRLENDTESLKAIGYVEFYGEEYGLRRSFSVLDATLHLYNRFNATKKTEYSDYAEYLDRGKSRWIPIILFQIFLFILLAFAFGEI